MYTYIKTSKYWTILQILFDTYITLTFCRFSYGVKERCKKFMNASLSGILIASRSRFNRANNNKSKSLFCRTLLDNIDILHVMQINKHHTTNIQPYHKCGLLLEK